MGLRGPGARGRKPAAKAPKRRDKPVWDNPSLSRVERVIAFLEDLPITKGILQGQKMVLLPGQREFVESVYGRVDKEGKRVVRLAIKSEPRGNGKTGLIAGLALCHLLGPEAEPRGEIYSAAVDKMQAGILYNEMEAIIVAVPEYDEQCNCQRFHKKIEVLNGNGAGSIYESLSADNRRGHGLAPSLWIYDELAQAPDDRLLNNLETGGGKRKESLGMVISTQAARDDHPLSELIDDALLGTDASVHLQLRTAPEESDPFDERIWFDCNEALDKFLDIGQFRREARQAKRLPSKLAAFRNLRLNQRIDAETRYISDADWMQCAAPVNQKDLLGRVCFAGLDLSQTTDMTALVLYFPDDGSVLPFFWLPEEGLEESEVKARAHYKLWRDQGLLETTPGRAINYQAIVMRLAEISKTYDVVSIAYDRAFIKQLQRLLDEEGIVLPLQEFGQGYVSMAPAVQLLEAAVLDRRLRHGGHPVLRWNMGNVAIEMDPAGNRKVTKKRSRGHVDGVIGLLMAIAAASKTQSDRVYPVDIDRITESLSA